MSLDIYLTVVRPTTVFGCNITHNLSPLAEAVGLYQPLWRPEELGITRAEQVIDLLERGLRRLRDASRREEFRGLEPENGWGSLQNLVDFTECYLVACRDNPDALIQVSR